MPAPQAVLRIRTLVALPVHPIQAAMPMQEWDSGHSRIPPLERQTALLALGLFGLVLQDGLIQPWVIGLCPPVQQHGTTQRSALRLLTIPAQGAIIPALATIL